MWGLVLLAVSLPLLLAASCSDDGASSIEVTFAVRGLVDVPPNVTVVETVVVPLPYLTPHFPLPDVDEVPPDELYIYAHFGDDRAVLVDTTDDPRWWHVAAPLVEGDPGGGRVKRPDGIFDVLFPCNTTAVTVRYHGVSPFRFPIRAAPRHRRLQTLQSTDIVHKTLQKAGPVEQQNNIVFLSAGYLKSQQARFDADAATALEFMKIPAKALEAFKDSVPFARYASVLNVFTVFQPSPQEGASRPKIGLEVENNLRCTYGNDQGEPERMLSCNMDLAADLASTAPCGAKGKKNVVVVSLVNAETYGGAGMYHATRSGTVYRQASFFNGFISQSSSSSEKQKFASLFFHEVGHAYANLFDEYSFGTASGGEVVETPNCIAPGQPTKWAGWINLASTDRFDSVSPKPVPVCGYTDYSKPSTSCIMDKLTAERVCPVCREAGVLAFYETGHRITNPRCPQEAEVVVLEPGGFVWLYTNKRLVDLQEFEIVWSYNGSPLTSSIATSLRVAACPPSGCPPGTAPQEALGEGRHEFTLTITDQTTWVLPVNRVSGMTDSTTFSIEVVKTGMSASVPDLKARDCHTGDQRNLFILGQDGAEHKSYCLQGTNKTCEMNFTSSAYQQSKNLDGIADEIESMVFGIVGGAIGGVLLFFLLIWCCLARENSKRAKCIYKEDRPKYLEAIRWIMIGSAILFMLGAAGSITIGLLYYSRLGAIGKILLFAALGLALLLFIIAFVGFTGAWYRSKMALTVNGVLLSLCLTVAIGAMVFSIMFHENIGNADSWSHKWMEDLWVHLAENDDAMLCSLEHALKCSGFFVNCQKVQSKRYCPENCEENHIEAWAAEPCKHKIEEAFEDNWVYIVIICVGVTVMMIMACVFNFLLRRSIGRFKHRVRADRRRRSSYASQSTFDKKGQPVGAAGILAILHDLTDEERVKLKGEFQRVDKDGDGTLNKKEFRFFIKTALMHKATPEDVDELFKTVDTDANGRLSFAEFVTMLKIPPQHHLSPNTSDGVAVPQSGAPMDSTAPYPYQYQHQPHYKAAPVDIPQDNLSSALAAYTFPATRPSTMQAPELPKSPDQTRGLAEPLLRSEERAGAGEWRSAEDPAGNGTYYYNTATRATCWNPPWRLDKEPPSSSTSPRRDGDQSLSRIMRRRLMRSDVAGVALVAVAGAAVSARCAHADWYQHEWFVPVSTYEKRRVKPRRRARQPLSPPDDYFHLPIGRNLPLHRPGPLPLTAPSPSLVPNPAVTPLSATLDSRRGEAYLVPPYYTALPPAEPQVRKSPPMSMNVRLGLQHRFEEILETGTLDEAIAMADHLADVAPEVMYGVILDRATIPPIPSMSFIRQQYPFAIHALKKNGAAGLAHLVSSSI